MFSKVAAVVSVVLPVVLADQVLWGQCGGMGYSGEMTCVPDSICTFLNTWYSQCIPPTATISTPTPTPPPKPPAEANYWFSFGDSYTQSGFAIDGAIPAVGNPLGNPPYPGWTSSGGENWIDLTTTKYNKSLVLTYNYAYGGATINSSLVAPYDPSVLSLGDQVDQYLSTAAKKPETAPWTSKNSLFSIWIGINDIGNSYYLGGNRSEFAETLLDNYFSLVQSIYETGGRNFLFLNVPPIDRAPLALGSDATYQTIWKNTIFDFNSRLASHVAAFKAANSGVTAYIWDANTAFGKYLDAPASYGFVDSISYGSTGDFWINDLHPTAPAHDLFAKDVAKVLTNTIW